MKRLLACIGIFFVVGISPIWSSSYDEGLGEKNIEEYAAQRDPLIAFNRLTGKVFFTDKLINNSFYNPYTSIEVFNLANYWQQEFLANASCPLAVYKKNYTYIRYIFRLMAMSYVFETLKELEHIRYNLSGESGQCRLDWKNLFGKCSPKTVDLKTFVTRVRYFLHKRDRQLQKGRKLPGSKKMYAFAKKITQKRSNLIGAKIVAFYAKIQGVKLTTKNITKMVDRACRELQSNQDVICSEQDSFYAGINLPFLYPLVASSNAMNVFKNMNMAKACVSRFAQTSRSQGRTYPLFEYAFPLIYQKLSHHKKVSYQQGELFLPGALKEFDDLGLSDFLYVKPLPTPRPKIKVVKKIIKKKKIVPRPRPTPPPRTVVKPKPRPTPTPKLYDHFYLAVQKLMHNTKAKQQEVDILALLKDHPFSAKMIKKIATPLSLYQRVKSLKEMKKYDQIGSKKTPVILSFLLYMLAYHQHQGLFNVNMVLGNEFYVINNYDKEHQQPVLIRLLNDETTNYQWKMWVIKKPQ